jgi:hypothetical protein
MVLRQFGPALVRRSMRCLLRLSRLQRVSQVRVQCLMLGSKLDHRVLPCHAGSIHLNSYQPHLCRLSTS